MLLRFSLERAPVHAQGLCHALTSLNLHEFPGSHYPCNHLNSSSSSDIELDDLFRDDTGDSAPVISCDLRTPRCTLQELYKNQNEMLSCIKYDSALKAPKGAFPHVTLQSATRFMRFFTYDSANFIDMDLTLHGRRVRADVPHIMMDRNNVCCLDLEDGCRISASARNGVEFIMCAPHVVARARLEGRLMSSENQGIVEDGLAVDSLFANSEDFGFAYECSDINEESLVNIFAYGNVDNRACFTSFPSYASFPSFYDSLVKFLTTRIRDANCQPCPVTIESTFLALSFLDISVGSETSMALLFSLLNPPACRGCVVGFQLGTSVATTVINIIAHGLTPVPSVYFPIASYVLRSPYNYTPLTAPLVSDSLWVDYMRKHSKTWLLSYMKDGLVHVRVGGECSRKFCDQVLYMPADMIPARAAVSASLILLDDMIYRPHAIRSWSDVYTSCILKGLRGGGRGDGKKKGRQARACSTAASTHNEKSKPDNEARNIRKELENAAQCMSTMSPPEGSTYPISSKGNRCGAYSVYHILREHYPKDVPELELDQQYAFVKSIGNAIGVAVEDSMLCTETIVAILTFCKIRCRIYIVTTIDGKVKFQPVVSSLKFRYAGVKGHVQTPLARILWFNNHFEPIKEQKYCNNDISFCAEFSALQCCTAPSMVGTSPFLRQGGEKHRIPQGKLVPVDIPTDSHVLAFLSKVASSQDLAFIRSCVKDHSSKIVRIYPRGLLLGTDATYPDVWREYDQKCVAYAKKNSLCFKSEDYPAMATLMQELVAGEASSVHMPNNAPISPSVDEALKRFVNGGKPEKVVERSEKVVSRPEKTTAKTEEKSASSQPLPSGVGSKSAPPSPVRSEVPATVPNDPAKPKNALSASWSYTSASSISYADIVKSIPRAFSWDGPLSTCDFESIMAESTFLPSYDCVKLIDEMNARSALKMEYPTNAEEASAFSRLAASYTESSTLSSPPHAQGTPVGSENKIQSSPIMGAASVVSNKSGVPVSNSCPIVNDDPKVSINSDDPVPNPPPSSKSGPNSPPRPSFGAFATEAEITKRGGCIYHTEVVEDKTPLLSFLSSVRLCKPITAAHSFFEVPKIGTETPGADRRIFPFANDALIAESKVAKTVLHEIKHEPYDPTDASFLTKFALKQASLALENPVLLFPRLAVASATGLLSLYCQIRNEKSYLASFQRRTRIVHYDHAVVENLPSLVDYTGKSDGLAPGILQARIKVTAPFVNTKADVTFGVDETNTLEGTQLFAQAFYQYKRRMANNNIETLAAAQKAVVDGLQ